ncbi:MAG: isoamylase [Pirellulaceae bacterium]
MQSNRWETIEGAVFPLGASVVASERAYNFALYSKHATRVRLLLYSATDVVRPMCEYDFDYLKNKSGPVWHCRIPWEATKTAQQTARYYAYQVDGPAPEPGYNWHSFDFEKILLDPYAHSVFFPSDFNRQAACRPGSNAGKAPLGVLPFPECTFDWQDDQQPRHDWNLVIYELHVRGFTQHASSNVSESHRGTFLGVIDKIPYLKSLGITAVELMPVFQFDPDENNYWGYMPLNFFSPHHAYATDPNACEQHNEFRTMVKALHAEGIEVILDVVYNHTCEGDHRGPTYSWKGIDNSTAYIVTGNADVPYANYSGTGNTIHSSNRAMRRCILESLRYWDKQMHVDGFRFDLASIFTRNDDGSINLDNPPIISDIGTEAELSDNRIIAEPWDAGGEFQLGRKFPGQRAMQWNSRYRDTLQRFVRGDSGMIPELMTRLYGSDDLFPDDCMHAYQPSLSVNYVTSHDGSTLYDLVAFRQRRNWANGHNNQDGARNTDVIAAGKAQEGVPQKVQRLRQQLVKNFFCLLMLSNGTPMFRMGDEFLNSQQGNNNPYNQDNEISWLDWSNLQRHQDVFRFFREMISFRKSHPSFSRSRFWRSDIRWYGAGPFVDMSDSSQQLAYCLHGASQHDNDFYVMINAAVNDLEFGLHEGTQGQWRRVIDTSQSSPRDIDVNAGVVVQNASLTVLGQSVVVLTR